MKVATPSLNWISLSSTSCRGVSVLASGRLPHVGHQDDLSIVFITVRYADKLCDTSLHSNTKCDVYIRKELCEFSRYGSCGLNDTSLQSNTKCDVYIRKEILMLCPFTNQVLGYTSTWNLCNTKCDADIREEVCANVVLSCCTSWGDCSWCHRILCDDVLFHDTELKPTAQFVVRAS